MMDSTPIAEFIESTYPDPPVLLKSDFGAEIMAKSRGVLGPLFRMSVTPREIHILSPRSQEYFRRTREAMLGHRLEDLLDPETEDEKWQAADEDRRAISELILKHEAEGPFVLGAQPSYTDFFYAGSIQTARVIDEGVFKKLIQQPGPKAIYEACLPYMERKD